MRGGARVPDLPTADWLVHLRLVGLRAVTALPLMPPVLTLTLIFRDFLLWVRLEAKVLTTQIPFGQVTLIREPGTERSTWLFSGDWLDPVLRVW